VLGYPYEKFDHNIKKNIVRRQAMSDMNISSFMSKIDGAVTKKVALFDQSRSRYLFRLIFPGFFLTCPLVMVALFWVALLLDYLP